MKKGVLYSMMGGLIFYGYLKYKDGTLERYIKNMKPMIESTINDLKK